MLNFWFFKKKFCIKIFLFRPIFRINTDVVPARKSLPLKTFDFPQITTSQISNVKISNTSLNKPSIDTPSRDLSKLSLSLNVSQT